MVSEEMIQLGTKRSVIREIFEYGNQRAAAIGRENVFDFSIGNPSVPAPPSVAEALRDIVENTDPVKLHAYSSAQGHYSVRKAITDYNNRRFGTTLDPDLVYMTAGAAASLAITFHALACKGDNFITFAPYFTEYKTFVNGAGCALKIVPARTEDFQIDFAAFESLIDAHTKGVIINSPNNPSGVVYSEQTIMRLAQTLKKRSAEYGHTIYLVSDEPYRDLAYGGVEVPCVFRYYDEVIQCYSFSKALSLPGERIGYIAVSDRAQDAKEIYAAVCGAGRALGYVCAPTLFQFLVERCVAERSDFSVYERNRNLLCSALEEYGFTCAKPDGAFYIFVRSPEADATAFCERAKKYELLFVPGDDFGCAGYVRIAYCVSTELIKKALPAFAKLAKEYGLQ